MRTGTGARTVAAGGTICLLLLCSQRLHAQAAAGAADDPAKKHFSVGAVLYNDGNYAGALVEFKTSYAAQKNVKVCTYVGLALQALNRYAEAEAELLKCLADAGEAVKPDAKAEIEDILKQLASVIGSVQVTCAVAGAAVSFDGAAGGTTPLAAPVRLNVGHHTIVVKKEGCEGHFGVYRGKEKVAGYIEDCLDRNG